MPEDVSLMRSHLGHMSDPTTGLSVSDLCASHEDLRRSKVATADDLTDTLSELMGHVSALSDLCDEMIKGNPVSGRLDDTLEFLNRTTRRYQ